MERSLFWHFVTSILVVTVSNTKYSYGQSDNGSTVSLSTTIATTLTYIEPNLTTTSGSPDTEKDLLYKVYGAVGTNVTMPCRVPSLMSSNDSFFITTWKKVDSVQLFLANAQKNANGDLEVIYLDESLKDKYTILNEYSLVVKFLEIDDTSNYTCNVMMFKSIDQQVVKDRFLRNTLLIVQAVPSPPGRPSILKTGSRTITVKWEPSLTDHNSPITSYLARIKPVEGKSPTKEKVVAPDAIKSAKISGLQPYTAYRVSIFAINKIGPSKESGESDIFLTLQEVPEERPQNLLATSNHSSRIHLSWSPPPENKIHGDLKHYEIMYRMFGSNQEQVITTENPDKTEITIYGLLPYREYEIFVRALNGEGRGPAAYTLIFTAEGIPLDVLCEVPH